MPLPEPRFVVTELEGYPITHGSTHGNGRSNLRPGLSCMVIDRHVNHRLVATFRSEDQTRFDGRFARNDQKVNYARILATAHAERLNAR